MDAYVIRAKLMPPGPEVESQKLLDSLGRTLGKDLTIRNSRVEQIAYGLYQLIVDIVAPERDGVVDDVERQVSSTPLVANYEILGVSRLSSRLRTS